MNQAHKHPAEFSADLDGMLAAVAELYYKDGLTQAEIGKRLGLSRQTIVSYLRQSRARGIVEIKIRGSAYAGSDLSRALRARFALQDVYIGRTAGLSAADAKRATARLGAVALEGLLVDRDVLGVSWGGTVELASKEMPGAALPNTEVLQLMGSTSAPGIDSPEASTIRIAGALRAACRTLHAPAILSSPALAASLRAEPVLREQLARFDALDKAFFSVGGLEAGTMIAASGVARAEEMRQFREAGAQAVLCGHFIDAEGRQIGQDFAARMIGASLEQIRAARARICVADGRAKRDAVRAAIAGGFVTHLVVDQALAEAL